MLNSAFGNILRSKQVGTAMPVDPNNPNDDSRYSDSEAEVRLVVRFIVEEHIVFNGKVERVNQLESEELSRVVSRVAWDGANEVKKSLTSPGDLASDEPTIIEPEEIGLQEAHSNDNNTNISPVDASEEFTSNPTPTSTTSPAPFEGDLSNNQSSGQLVSISLHLSDIQEVADLKVSVAQEKSSVNIKSSTESESDIPQERHKKCICEVKQDEKPSQDPPKIQENDIIRVNAENLVETFETNISDAFDPAQEEDTESQSVSDALKDCVENIDLEFRREAEAALEAHQVQSPNNPHVQPDSQADSHPVTTTNAFKQSGNVTQSILNEAGHYEISTSISEDHSHSNDIDLSEGYIVEEVVHNDVACIDKAEPMEPVREGSSSNKRRASYSQTTGKRSRKESTSCNKNCKSKATKSRQCQDLELNASPKISGPISLLADDHYMGQSKIFAKWSDNHFYPGTILRPAKDRKFLIAFFDGAQRNVSETDLIPLRNIEGKQVRVSIAKNYCVNAIVHDQSSPVNDQPMFDVEYQQNGLIRRCVPLKDIFLTGEQGTPLINQVDRNSGASNFADVDLDNIIYEKRSRRLQEMDDYELTENPNMNNNKRKRGQYNMRNGPKSRNCGSTGSHENQQSSLKKPHQADLNHDSENFRSLDVVKSNSINSNTPSEGSSPVVSSNVSNDTELEQDFYFASSSPHRTKTSLLL